MRVFAYTICEENNINSGINYKIQIIYLSLKHICYIIVNSNSDCKGTALCISKCKVFTIAMHSKNKCLDGSDGASLLWNKKIYCFLIKGQAYSSNANTCRLGIDDKYFINLAEVKAVTSFFL